MNDFVTVIVPCRNEAKHVRLFLDGLLRQETAGLPWEVIIADGMSTDGTREVLREYCLHEPRIHVIDNPAQSVASGLNAAIRAAAGNIILQRFMEELVARSSLVIALYGRSGVSSCGHSEHMEIVNALEQGAAPRAQVLIVHHIDHIEADLDLRTRDGLALKDALGV